MIRQFAAIGAWLVLSTAWSHAACATTVYADTVLVSGAESLSVFELPLDAPGGYRVTATDLGWLNTSLQTLSFGVFTSTQTLATGSGPGTIEFFYAGAGPVYLQLYARTTALHPAGLIGINAATVVALPSSIVLLLSAMLAAILPRLKRWSSVTAFVSRAAPGV
jgi:hypothetical protein